MIKEVLDLSCPMESLATPVFPGYPQPLKSAFTTIQDNGYRSYVWSFVEHTSTHVDSPAHFLQDGKTIDKIPISRYVSNGLVLDFSKKTPNYVINKVDIMGALQVSGKKDVGPGWALLFYTGYTSKAASPEWLHHPELNEEAAAYIASKNVNAIGFDAPSPDHGQISSSGKLSGFAAHRILLPKEIAVYENLNNLHKLLNKEFLFVGATAACGWFRQSSASDSHYNVLNIRQVRSCFRIERLLTPGGEPEMAHVGSTSMRKMIEKLQPLAGLHGHIHESKGVTRMGKTQCFNPLERVCKWAFF
jgi:kynurenine formamidase